MLWEVNKLPRQATETVEYRNYELPEHFPVLLLSGEKWRISDIPSGVLHFHNCIEIGLCESDFGTMEFMDEKVPFKAKDITFVSNNISHTTYSAPGTASKWTYIFVDIIELLRPMFPISLLDESSTLLDLVHNFYGVFDSKRYPELNMLITEAALELTKKDINYQFSVRGLLMSFIIRLQSIYLHIKEKNNFAATLSSHSNVLVIAPVLDFISTHYMENYTIDDLAELCGLSTTHFRRVFTSIIGCGPLKYTNNLRIQKASVLLRTTEMPILAISEEVGFHSLSSFNRHFMEDYNEPPKEWRRNTLALLSPSIRKFSGWLVPPTAEVMKSLQ